jgi:uncharacterized protein (TIGR00255 family)
MALWSMTGYGRAEGEVGGLPVSVEVRSVNHKGLDVKIAAPGSLGPLEAAMLQAVRERLGRGRVDVRVRLGGGGNGRGVPVVDVEAARALYAQLDGLTRALGMVEAVTLGQLLSVRDVVLRDPDEVSLGEASWPAILAVLGAALELHVAERAREGEALAADMRARLVSILGHVEAIAQELPRCQEGYLERLRERVKEAVARFGLGELPEERLMQEVILFAERSDVTEELVRARTHAEMLLRLIDAHDPAKDGPVGKKLDFYFQELNREANTTGSKSQSVEIAARVVEIRGELDRLREQALNLV